MKIIYLLSTCLGTGGRGENLQWNMGEEELGNVTEHFWKKMKSSEISLKGKAGVSSLAGEAGVVGKGVSGDCIKNNIYMYIYIHIYIYI